MLVRQMANYRDDPRAVFVYTFTPVNIDEAREVTELLAEQWQQITFNMFSAPVGYNGPSSSYRRDPCQYPTGHDANCLPNIRRPFSFPPIILLPIPMQHGLHDLFSCSYPRMNPSTDIGLGRSFRQYRTDLQWDRDAACCVPDTDCDDCRHYAAGSAVVTARMYRHATDPVTFSAWLDYVDTYLAVWVRGYEKGTEPL